ncbi:MAG: serine hydrolase [Planctomycetota bacterium]
MRPIVAYVLLVSACRAQATAVAPPVPRALLEIGTGYAAKVIGSAVFVSGRAAEDVLAAEFAGETPLEQALRPLLHVDEDAAARTLTVRAGDVARTVVFRPGLGCTLAIGCEPRDLAARVVEMPAWPLDLASRPWPIGDSVADEPWPEGADEEALRAAVDAQFVERAEHPIRTRAVVVAFRDRLMYERYAPGFDRDMALAGWSMSKAVTGALVGIALRQERLRLDDPLPIAAWRDADDPRRHLTWRMLLRMSSGLTWDESYTDPAGSVPRMLFGEPCAGDFAAQKPPAQAPNQRWQYSSGTTNILCRALRATFASDDEYLSFPRRELFAKLGMRSAVLEPDPRGIFVGSSFVMASARDWVRFGLLYLHDGVWNEERILPEGYVAACTTAVPWAPKGRYGMHWSLNVGEPEDPQRRPYPNLPRDAFMANGYQGQKLVIVPSRQFVMVRLGCTKVERDFRDEELVVALLAALP